MSESDIEALKTISFDKLLDELFEKERKEELIGPNAEEMLTLLDSSSMRMVFTMGDVCLLVSPEQDSAQPII